MSNSTDIRPVRDVNGPDTPTNSATRTGATGTITAEQPVYPGAAAPSEPVEAHVVAMTPETIDQIRQQVEEASGGGSRFAWFLIGFVAAIVAGVVAAIVFLAVSSTDDDGNIELDVPAVDVSVGG